MKRCKTCKYWESNSIWNVSGYSPCLRCGGRNGYAEYPDSAAFASDSEAYGAQLLTLATFGCTEWAKDE